MNTLHRTAIAAAALIASAGSASANFNLFDALFNPPPPRQQQAAEPEATPDTGDYIAPAVVGFPGQYRAGTVVVSTSSRRLYYVLPGGQAIRYSIGVARSGFEWSGAQTISQKQEWPDWRPPAEMIQRRPDLPRYMTGGEHNPMGARAMYLGNTLYRIHGSNEPDSIGHAVSSGCIRMLNADVVDLYSRVQVGTPVVVTR